MVKKSWFSSTFSCEWCNESSYEEYYIIEHEKNCIYRRETPQDEEARKFERETRISKKEKELEKANNLSAQGGLKNLIQAYDIYNYYHEGYDTYKTVVGPLAKDLAEEYEKNNEYNKALDLYVKFKFNKESNRVSRFLKKEKKEGIIKAAKNHERLLEFDEAVGLYKKIKMERDIIRVRKLKADMSAPKTEIHGDYVDDRDTIVKDSVINRSNVGGGSSKMQELKDLAEMKEKGLIDDDEFNQMKKEILGK